MSKEDQEQIINELEQAKINWQRKLVYCEQELSITASSVEKFQLKEVIKQCQEEIKRINSQLESLKQ